MFSRDEMEREFRRYSMTGPVLEEWAAWANLFTDDATYHDHFYGTFTGPGGTRRGPCRQDTPARRAETRHHHTSGVAGKRRCAVLD
jgi:hypothetical protein